MVDVASQMPFVLVVEDPKKGDFANVLAIGELLAERLGARVETVRMNLRHRQLVRCLGLLLALGGRLSFERSQWLRQCVYRLFFSGTYPGKARPLAVISTLGRGEAQGAFIGRFWQTQSVHLGSPKRLSRKNFSAVLTHPGDTPRNREIPLALAPTRMRLRRNDRSAEEKPTIRKICLLLGGSTKGGMHYSQDFWSRSIAAAVETAQAHDAALMVSTSPRSGPRVEDIVETALCGHRLPECRSILYGRGDRCDLAAELMSADAALITAESISMMSDAIASGARLLALYDGDLPISPRHQRFLKTQSDAETLRLADLSKWNAGPLSLDGIKPIASCWSDMLWERLAPLFAETMMRERRWALADPATAPSS